MSFLYPDFLWALFALSIPVIIHLFNFRKYKVVYFSNIQLLRNVEQETRSRSRLKQWLILLTRLLLITALVFAFAQPIIIYNNNSLNKEKVVSIYIDNSFSMEAEGKNGKLLEFAKSKVPDIISAYGPDKKFILLTNDREIKHQFALSREQLFEYIPEITISPVPIKLSDICQREKDIRDNESISTSDFFILSDFQKITANLATIKPDSNTNINFIPISPQNNNNLFIDSIWFDQPVHSYGQIEIAHILIKNTSDENYHEIPVNLYINDSLKAIGSINIKGNSEELKTLSYKNTLTGISQGKIEITDYPVVYDNSFFFSYQISEKLNVLIINPTEKTSRYLNALFKNDSLIDYKNIAINKINYSELNNYQTIIINQTDTINSGLKDGLINFIKQGGSLIYIPGEDQDMDSFNNFISPITNDKCIKTDTAKKIIDYYNKEHFIYKNVFIKLDKNAEYPFIKNCFILSKNSNSKSAALLKDRKGNSFYNHSVYGDGNLFYFTFSMNESNTNFTGHPIYIPSIINVVLNSGSKSREYYFLSKQQNIQIDAKTINKECNLTINGKGGFTIYPDNQLNGNIINIQIGDQIEHAGNYFVKCKGNNIGTLSFNYAREESALNYFSSDDIEGFFPNNTNVNIMNAEDKYFSKSITESNEGIPLWKYFLLAALFFVILEVLIIRFIK